MTKKIPVTLRAILTRVNRKLAIEGQVLHTAREPRRRELGMHYVVGSGGVVRTNVDAEEFARELGVLRQYEKIVE
jgi:hypothetical protein